MIAEIIVFAAAAFALAFTAAYLLRPDVRAWIEQPKHRFHTSVQQYDRDQVITVQREGDARS